MTPVTVGGVAPEAFSSALEAAHGPLPKSGGGGGFAGTAGGLASTPGRTHYKDERELPGEHAHDHRAEQPHEK